MFCGDANRGFWREGELVLDDIVMASQYFYR